jgi:hypothetical protein
LGLGQVLLPTEDSSCMFDIVGTQRDGAHEIENIFFFRFSGIFYNPVASFLNAHQMYLFITFDVIRIPLLLL